jgi:hypothetical protein
MLAAVLLAAFLGPAALPADWADTPPTRHTAVLMPGSGARVGAFVRGERITRLYGDAFSFGSTPRQSADRFLSAGATLFGARAADLAVVDLQPIMYLRESGTYKFTGVNYRQERDGIPVFGSRLVLLVRNEPDHPLVLASADLRDLGEFRPGAERNGIDPARGLDRARMLSPNVDRFTEPELVIWAGTGDESVDPVLAFTFVGDNIGSPGALEPEKYLFVADARTGEILYQEDQIYFVDVTGSVGGMATEGKAADFCEAEVVTGLPWARVNIGSTVAFADGNGAYTIPNSGGSPVTVESRLWGSWFRVWNQAGAEELLTRTVTPPGPADFLHNSANSDEFVRAQVNGYLQANAVRDFTLTYNPAYPGLQQNDFPVYVNESGGYCPGNAWYDGASITFCRSGSGYPNTAWSTVIHHEYGHHLVALAGSGQGMYGEGMGDVMGLLITDDPGTGWGFYGNCNQPLRTGDNTMQYPCSGEIHFCGQLISGCVWSTRNELLATNPGSYMDILANLAVNSILLHTGDIIDPSITVDYLTLDDDDGNILNGTPHYAEIAAGFGAHNMDAPELALLSFDFPAGLPEIVLPEGGSTLRVEVTGVSADPQPGTGRIFTNDGSGWTSVAMTEITPNVYDAVFPAAVCGTPIAYYFTAETTDMQTQVWPAGAPAESYVTVAAVASRIEFADDFEADLGWTVENDPFLTTGAWERGIPVGGGTRGDPPTDFDASGRCYLTDNRSGDSDIDGGITWLITPTLDLSGAANAKVSYALWYSNDYGADPNNDLFHVYVSDDDGGSWVLAQTFGPVSLSGWNEFELMVGDFVSLTNQVKVRFEASDLNSGSVVEAAVDQFQVTVFECAPADVSIQIIPDNPPVMVPAGGSFTYTGILTNNVDAPQTTDVWFMATLPGGGGEVGPVELFEDVPLGPSQVLQVDNIAQNVPPGAPAGTYTWTANAGIFPDVIVSTSSFPVTVTSTPILSAD